MKSGDGRRTNGGAGEIVRTAGLAFLIAMLLAASVAVVSVARTIDIAPEVGDILVFRQGTTAPADWEFTVARSSGTTCTLVPSVMASGGSLVVEQRLANSRSYSVHWAGLHTSAGASDCGRAADLVVPHEQLQLLSNAAGGPGVEHRSFGYF